ncbi:hypothetical protein EN845_01265 [Mesorhizobium sp. M8A.F.Ca.ET.202.01.1.1]|nr:hypothetical protein [Mesorhizobium sp. M8A.F.Ca.ET.198.01.1.1]TGR34637.1 hypothetical protein EN845_01265 [Mesorhizobium sp. M8A.F.Ca.ET.202.01.1.1]TGR58249.1 hypothetical protein EN842_01265 [bacterium M00.F.Ca.ET.199.01.1.1]TGV89733.1 hypothetical protein EN792_006135 [Mesorhizobium sp. M00.F.Ca.ET.149.01.1.1]
MKSNLDDPMTTANTDTGKFYFNSEIQKVGYIKDIFAVDADFTTYPASGGTVSSPNNYYVPSGSNQNTCQIYIGCWQSGGSNFQQWFFYQEYFAAQYGFTFYPLVESRPCINFTTNNFRGPFINISGNGSSNGTIFSYTSANSRTRLVRFSGSSGPSGRNRPALIIPNVTFGLTDNSAASPAYKRCLITVFDLPMHSEAIPDNSTTPSSGQEVVRFDKVSPGIARVALAGRTVADTDASHYILHENRIPAKVMASGTITVGAFATATITTRLPMTNLTYMDYICKKTSESTFWHPPFIGSYSAHANDFTYTMSGTTLTIVSNCDVSIDIIYVVYADSGEAPTTGGKKILLKGNDGISDYVQVKRPGSSELGPNLNDIMLDTRLTYLPILAEGFLNWSSDFPTVLSGSDLFKGVRSANITVPNPQGLLLFPKVGAVYNLPTNTAAFGEPSAVWGEHGVFVNNATWAGKSTGWSTWANVLSSTSVDIFASNNNPDGIQPTAAFFDSQLKGARYYIFGVPQSL